MLRPMMKPIIDRILKFLAPVALWLDERSPKQDYMLCTVLGLLNALAMPPVHLVPILLMTFPTLVYLLDKSLTVKQVFIKTFLFFFAFHVAGLYWINFALFVDIKNNWWVIPFALSGLPFLMALYPSIATWLWYRMAWTGSTRLVALIVLLTLSEWVRGTAFTGFPWNLWGYTWVFFEPVLQSVSLVGIYGLTFLTVALACMPMFFARNYYDRFGRLVVTIIITAFLGLTSWGMGRLAQELPQSAQPFNIRIVQPNITQEAKLSLEKRHEQEKRLWRLTIAPNAQDPSITPHMVMWPETAIPLFTTYDVRRLEATLQAVLPPKTFLAVGALEIERDDNRDKNIIANRINFYQYDGYREAFYDKFHLVPFGEYLPFENLWPVKPVAFSGTTMRAGDGLQTIRLNNIPAFSPLICYEVLFPGETTLKKDRPQWILNATNDAWYGNTSGPHQHLAITRTRAVEEGLPVIRIANTGISAVIDPMGRILKSLPLNHEGIIDHEMPAFLSPTLFARLGHYPFFMLLTLTWCVAWVVQRHRTPTLPKLK